MGVTLRKRRIAHGRQSFYLDIYYSQGNRKTVPLEIYLEPGHSEENRRKQRLAQAICRQAQEDFEHQLHNYIPPQRRKADFLVFFDSIIETRRGSTADGYRRARKHVEKFTGSTSVPFSALTPEWVRGFRQYLLADAGLHQNSARMYFDKVKAVVKEAVEANILHKSPFRRKDSIPQLESETTFATREELEALAKTRCSDPEVKRAYFFSVATGLRKIDIRQLDRSQIRGNRIAKRIEKTDNFTYKPLSTMARALLGELPEEGPLFNLPYASRLDYIMRKWVKDAGIARRLTFHSARHTFATQLLEAGADLVTVSRLLDHTDIKNTQRYLHVVDSRKAAAINALPHFDVRFD